MAESASRINSHDYNYQRIVEYIFNHRATSRSAIAKDLGLNKATVSLLCSEMQEQGVVSEIGSGSASSNGGRKPTLIEINRRYGYTLTVELDSQVVRALACYLDGETLQFQQRQTVEITDLPAALDELISHFTAIDGTTRGLLGICFAIHGITDGAQVQESFLELGSLDLRAYFAKYRVPILLENEANLSAIYSRDFVEEQGLENTVTLSIHQGIAAGFILENKLYRGSQGRVGNLGHNIVMPAFSINNSRSQVTYQDVYSEYAVIHQISDLLGKETMSLDEISKLYADHNAEVITVLSQFANGIAGILNNVVGMLDPDVFYLNSPLLHQIPSAIPQVRNYFQRLSGYDIPVKLIPNIQLATLLGGAALTSHMALGLTGMKLHFWDYTNN
ncbi:ROK family protein [Levilactobacillus tujiorum]|uniref:ROK family protein n=1 Tax=Levilactobacillus tujiorum TaxID=2912243 RepID=A0ABX1L2U5_9LACO|nr:ROK family protein [Levilactobacillus tujiorum]NLR11396.1 ROK family protein [Lactobacillus sp. HBUAS51387]NLR29356.1 ROK family protein [Levilactobacillus tujiorum]